MTVQDVKAVVGTVPHMSVERAQHLWQVIISCKATRLLELGTFHGTSACYLASALHEMGEGQLVTMDYDRVMRLSPPPTELLHKTGLDEYVDLVTSSVGYHWPLLGLLKTQAHFDLVYFDGGHTIECETGAYALLRTLADVIVFDDLQWSPKISVGWADKLQSRPAEWGEAKHVRELFTHVVRSDWDWWIDYGTWGVVGTGAAYNAFRQYEIAAPEAWSSPGHSLDSGSVAAPDAWAAV